MSFDDDIYVAQACKQKSKFKLKLKNILIKCCQIDTAYIPATKSLIVCIRIAYCNEAIIILYFKFSFSVMQNQLQINVEYL
jgi:hypothetical protein